MMGFDQYNEMNGQAMDLPSPKSRQKMSQPLVSNKNHFIYAINDPNQQLPQGNSA